MNASPASPAQVSVPSASPRSAADWLGLLWAAIAAAIVGRYFASVASVRWLTRDAEPVHDLRWRDACDVASAELGLARSPALVASDCARFGVPEVDRGAMGGGAHLQRLFPVQKVRHMYFTGDMIDAAEAYRLGAVERVVPRAELREAALEIARRIAAKSPAMIALAKEALTGIEDGNLEDKYRWEQGFTLQAYRSLDSQEARDAFVDKRAAHFKG